MEAAVARIEATVTRTEVNFVRLDRDAAETRGDLHNVRDQLARVDVKVTRADVTDVRDRLARLEAKVAHGRWFVISAVLIAIAAAPCLPLVSTAAAFRRRVAARDQARRLPGHRPERRQAGEALQPSGQRPVRPLPSHCRSRR